MATPDTTKTSDRKDRKWTGAQAAKVLGLIAESGVDREQLEAVIGSGFLSILLRANVHEMTQLDFARACRLTVFRECWKGEVLKPEHRFFQTRLRLYEVLFNTTLGELYKAVDLESLCLASSEVLELLLRHDHHVSLHYQPFGKGSKIDNVRGELQLLTNLPLSTRVPSGQYFLTAV